MTKIAFTAALAAAAMLSGPAAFAAKPKHDGKHAKAQVASAHATKAVKTSTTKAGK